jgi:hypothetical protein
MSKVLAFRRPEENCANCWYYTPHRKDYISHDVPPTGYCRHPDRTKDSYPICHPLIERLGIQCDPRQWCPKYITIDSPEMKKLQFISAVKFLLLCMQHRLRSSLDGIEKAYEYRELVDQFYMENKKLTTINQYKAAKRDSGYFVTLIEETIHYYKKMSKNRRQL